jgi:hypothetical protein
VLDENFGTPATVREDDSSQVTPVWVDWNGRIAPEHVAACNLDE